MNIDMFLDSQKTQKEQRGRLNFGNNERAGSQIDNYIICTIFKAHAEANPQRKLYFRLKDTR